MKLPVNRSPSGNTVGAKGEIVNEFHIGLG